MSISDIQPNILKDGRRLWYVTVATKPHPNLDILISICEAKGIHISVLGMNDKRLQEWGKGFGVKMYYLQQAVNSLMSAESANDIVLFTDAYDILITEDLDTIVKKYDSFNSDIVFCTEVYCHPDKNLASAYPKLRITKKDGSIGEPNHPFLNSGGFIGLLGSMHGFMQKYKYEIKDDDQGYWTNIYLQEHKTNGTNQNTSAVSLDTESLLFQCMAGAEPEMRWQKSDATPGNAGVRFTNILTGETPSILHFNGPKDGLRGYYYLIKMGGSLVDMVSDHIVLFVSLFIAIVIIVYVISILSNIPNMQGYLFLSFLFIVGFVMINGNTDLFIVKPRKAVE